jgi:hypothetical protein
MSLCMLGLAILEETTSKLSSLLSRAVVERVVCALSDVSDDTLVSVVGVSFGNWSGAAL